MGRHLLSLALAALASGCGASTNVVGLLTPQAQKESFENLLTVARAAYDRGDLVKALKFSREAYDYDHDSEEASVLYGYVNLSLAGGDPFGLAKALIATQNAKSAASATPAASSTTAPAATASTGGASDTLGALQQVIGLGPADLALMGKLDTSDPALPVLIPNCVEDVRSAVTKLTHLDAGIRAICPFIDVDARIADDSRQNCFPFTGRRQQRGRAHFLWAFSHLMEALAFNAVLTYGATDANGKVSNLELRVAKLKGLDTGASGVAALVTAVQGVTTTLNAVLPTSGKCSDAAPTTQLRATLDDMLAVSAAFDSIPGTPAKIVASIQAAVARLKAPPTVSAGSSTAAEALKGDFTKTMAKSLAAKIDALGTDTSHPISDADKTALCASYGAIAAGSGQASTLCSGASGATAP